MRLFHILPIISFLFEAGASSLDWGMPDAHLPDARDVPNVCAYLNTELEVPCFIFFDDDVGEISQSKVPSFSTYFKRPYSKNDFNRSCLCLSDVSQFVATNPVAISAVSVPGSGVQEVTDIITNLVWKNATVPLHECT